MDFSPKNNSDSLNEWILIFNHFLLSFCFPGEMKMAAIYRDRLLARWTVAPTAQAPKIFPVQRIIKINNRVIEDTNQVSLTMRLLHPFLTVSIFLTSTQRRQNLWTLRHFQRHAPATECSFSNYR